MRAAFELHGIDLKLPPNLAYSVGPGLTTTPVTHKVVDRIRCATINPVYAAAAAIQLFTGADVEELKFIPCVAFTGDALIFNSALGFADPADVCVWTIPPAARPLIDAALVFQEAGRAPDRLLAGGVGRDGQRLRDAVTAAGLTVPARYYWNRGWMWHTGMLWRGHRPVPRKKQRHPSRRRNEPTFQRNIPAPEFVTIEEVVRQAEAWRRSTRARQRRM
ncbi:hypothetical protein [Nocardia sp. bgisy134]|uniref:hypothetical protein n=1 Tax=Nocardia sp. bgisy134 TaxID=3413789 RepID=UPI003D72CFCA